MRRVFADTSFFVAMIGDRDQHHRSAVEFMRAYHGRLLTTDFVVVELGNYLHSVKDRPFFASIKRSLENDKQFAVVEASRKLLDRGVQLYLNRQDKKWSLTDCISFVVMEEHGITEALTSDGDFEQAGFNALLLN
jgi:predicted nucleic acid-binding protein